MISIENIAELNRIIRKHLINESEIESDKVRNALSTYGSSLDELLQKQEYGDIDECDELMLFELRTRDNDADVSMTEDDDTITLVKSYSVYVIIYGLNSATVMNALIARLRSQRVRQELYEEGVYLESVSNDTSLNEFKNDVLWHRHDTEINISCQMKITQTKVDNAYENADAINIKNKGDENNE